VAQQQRQVVPGLTNHAWLAPLPCPTAPAPHAQSGRCPRGDSCPYAHSVFELHLHPARYRTALCTMGASCRRTVCFFAHGPEQLRSGEDVPAPPPLPGPVPRGLSFDLAADGGAAAAAAMRAAAVQTGPGRSSLDTAAAAAAAGAAPAGASAPLPTSRALGGAPVRMPGSRASFDAIARPPSVGAAALADRMKRLSLPALLPAELGFTAGEEDSATPHGAAAAAGGRPPVCGGQHHPQQVRAAIALLEHGVADGAGVFAPPRSPERSGTRRAGLDGGSRPPPGGSWALAQATASELFRGALSPEQQQQLVSALVVQQQYEQMAAQQCELLAAERRAQLAPSPAGSPAPTAQLPPLFLQQARTQQPGPQLHAAQQQVQLPLPAVTAAQLSHEQQQEQQQAASLAALWLQERRAAAATAAAVAVAQQETNALAALRWSLAMQQAVATAPLQQQAAPPPPLPQALAGLLPGGLSSEIAVGGPTPELLSIAHQLSLPAPQFM
jgi:hypothetical protein